MAMTKIAITLEETTVERINQLVKRQVFPNRSRVIQDAVREKLEKLERNRLARECQKLDPEFEQALAEEGLSEELAAWPKY